MHISDAVLFVERELKKIEDKAGEDAVLQPWAANAHTLAQEWWGRTQQRIALSRKNPAGRWCCADLALEAEYSEAQRVAHAMAGERLKAARAS
jgi:hypothetical protein